MGVGYSTKDEARAAKNIFMGALSELTQRGDFPIVTVGLAKDDCSDYVPHILLLRELTPPESTSMQTAIAEAAERSKIEVFYKLSLAGKIKSQTPQPTAPTVG